MRKIKVLIILLGVMLIGVNACVSQKATHLKGAVVELGEGQVETFADFTPGGTLIKLGVHFSEGAVNSPPASLTDGNRCFDHNGNGKIEPEKECSHWHEKVIPLPSDLSRNANIPFKWALVNWNPHGHIPPGVWNKPHFDVHFYMEQIEDIFALKRGECGPEFMRCDQFEIAIKPVPKQYMHPDYINVKAAAPAMGNHLVDTTAAEFHGEPFTRSWIYGSYDGRVIFYEEMLAQDYMQSQPNDCYPIKTTPEVALSGYYPETVCSRVDEETGGVNVTLEDFVYRESATDS